MSGRGRWDQGEDGWKLKFPPTRLPLIHKMDVVRSQEMEVESYHENGFLGGLHAFESLSGGVNIFAVISARTPGCLKKRGDVGR